MVPRAAAAAATVIKPVFLLETCSNDDELLPACCAAALQEDNNADSVLPAKNRQREGHVEAERIFEGNYGTTWAHQRARKEEGLRPRCKEGY